jgi:hypothetical protein
MAFNVELHDNLEGNYIPGTASLIAEVDSKIVHVICFSIRLQQSALWWYSVTEGL